MALEWWKSDTGDWCADTMIGRYQVQATTRQASTSYYRLFVPRGKIQEYPDLCSSEDEAKATAQSHFDNAIRSALASEPANG
jgi:hypothetical protein